MKNVTKADKEVIQYGIDRLKDGFTGYGCDLHNMLYNEDYFIVGTYEAKQFLNRVGSFDAIGTIQEYEKSNFGEVTTDLNDPEKVANMYAYIKGEEALQESKTLQKKWDKVLDEEDCEAIIEELENLL